jgi:GNAT superfamily N-acetyltransferase
VTIVYGWRDEVGNDEINSLHAEAFATEDLISLDWKTALTKQALGWATARDAGRLVGFVNVIWDGLIHAWIQDVMVATDLRSSGIATHLIKLGREQAKEAGCRWLHVDFEESLGNFYYDSCGFRPTSAGLIALE